MTAEEEANIDWSFTTWKGSRLQQHREFHALSFRRKMEIIEELGSLDREFQEQRKRQGLPYISIETGERVAAWSFTDCVSFAVMRELRVRDAFTTDRHFRQAGFVPLLKT